MFHSECCLDNVQCFKKLLMSSLHLKRFQLSPLCGATVLQTKPRPAPWTPTCPSSVHFSTTWIISEFTEVSRMAFTFAAFAYIVALIIDAFLIFFAIFHVSFSSYSLLKREKTASQFHPIVKFPIIHLDIWLVIPTDHCLWRVENRLQEPYRPVRLTQPSCIARVSVQVKVYEKYFKFTSVVPKYSIVVFVSHSTELNFTFLFCQNYSNPPNSNPIRYILHILFNILFLFAGEWFSILLNAPLIGYHIHRYILSRALKTSLLGFWKDTLGFCPWEID